ncbi:hypothetical protein [Luteibacter sp. 9135]|uniref:hypothetical protein n=1 Tax=Luteibacter sp. 9135 TaxID=1500893 RepID=UPI000567138E|nr:hypothetical protein [Luteibacter sp. 9135]
MTTEYETINQRLIGELKAQRREVRSPAIVDPRRYRDPEDEAGQLADPGDAGTTSVACDDADRGPLDDDH